MVKTVIRDYKWNSGANDFIIQASSEQNSSSGKITLNELFAWQLYIIVKHEQDLLFI